MDKLETMFFKQSLSSHKKADGQNISVDSLLGGNFSVLVIKLDHEVGLRRYWYQYRAEFRAGSFYDGPEAIRGQFRA